MHYEITTSRVEARPIASIDVHASPDELDGLIPGLLDEVWTQLEQVGLDRPANNVVIYYGRRRCTSRTGIEVPARWEGEPGGRGARGALRDSGRPGGQDGARRPLRNSWARPTMRCGAGAPTRAISRWDRCGEVYGDWNDDTSKLRTEVFYLIESEA